MSAKEEGVIETTVADLIASFDKQYHELKDKAYKETPLRDDFLSPFLEILGWDVKNRSCKTIYKRDVLQEESIEIEGSKFKKAPDYTLRVNGIRKVFVEAKKPQVDITESESAAFQVKQYGWNAGLRISILSNFEHTIIYDCREKPSPNDDVSIGRYKVYHYKDYLDKLDEIRALLSYENVQSGSVENYFETVSRDYETFDYYFLHQIKSWRLDLAKNIIQKRDVNEVDLNLMIQKIINRLIFLRVCEDRAIEEVDKLKSVKSAKDLDKVFLDADKKYDSGLFDLEGDAYLTSEIVDDVEITKIISSLYYPLSPFDFSIVDPSILSQIYERFLGERIVIENGVAVQVEELEVEASKGVVPTPEEVVNLVVSDTLKLLIEERGEEKILDLKVADICCGSGTFLLGIYNSLVEYRLSYLISSKQLDSKDLVKIDSEHYELSLEGKIKVLKNCIFGVDINPYAVEVAIFSLSIKLLEGETSASIASYLLNHKCVLPKLDKNIQSGNSLVDDKYFIHDESIVSNLDDLSELSPFNWEERYPAIFENGGFDAIVGNPPFVRIQNLVKHFKKEVNYYRSDVSQYEVAKANNIDKYYVFLERAKELINDTGHLSYIVPSKFAILKGGKKLRGVLTRDLNFRRVLHFGTNQLFPNHSTYTAVFHFSKVKSDFFLFKRFKNVSQGELVSSAGYMHYSVNDFNSDPWIFLSAETTRIFDKIRENSNALLGNICSISVGLQTSKDDIYIFTPNSEDEKNYTLEHGEQKFLIEKSICKPCIKDLSFDGFEQISPNALMIFPYEMIDGQASLIPENRLRREFPNCYSYLHNFKDVLSSRNLGGKSPVWYQFGRSQSLSKFLDSDKLIWTVLTLGPKYILDQKNILFTGGGNGPYYGLLGQGDISIRYILGILNHPLIELMVKAGASEFRGDYYSHGKQFIEKLPIIKPETDAQKALYSEIINIVDDLLVSKSTKMGKGNSTALQTQQKFYRQKLVDKVGELLGITDEEIEIVEQDEAFS